MITLKQNDIFSLYKHLWAISVHRGAHPYTHR